VHRSRKFGTARICRDLAVFDSDSGVLLTGSVNEPRSL